MSKYQDAIDAIKSNYPTENYTILREGLDLAIEVLEKQMPGKPTAHDIGKSDTTYYCKNCGNYVSKRDNYCRICGKKIEWDE